MNQKFSQGKGMISVYWTEQYIDVDGPPEPFYANGRGGFLYDTAPTGYKAQELGMTAIAGVMYATFYKDDDPVMNGRDERSKAFKLKAEYLPRLVSEAPRRSDCQDGMLCESNYHSKYWQVEWSSGILVKALKKLLPRRFNRVYVQWGPLIEGPITNLVGLDGQLKNRNKLFINIGVTSNSQLKRVMKNDKGYIGNYNVSHLVHPVTGVINNPKWGVKFLDKSDRFPIALYSENVIFITAVPMGLDKCVDNDYESTRYLELITNVIEDCLSKMFAGKEELQPIEQNDVEDYCGIRKIMQDRISSLEYVIQTKESYIASFLTKVAEHREEIARKMREIALYDVPTTTKIELPLNCKEVRFSGSKLIFEAVELYTYPIPRREIIAAAFGDCRNIAQLIPTTMEELEFYLGSYEVSIDMGDDNPIGTYEVTRIESKDKDMLPATPIHPHYIGKGTCLGNMAEGVQQLAKGSNLVDIMNYLVHALRSINTEDSIGKLIWLFPFKMGNGLVKINNNDLVREGGEIVNVTEAEERTEEEDGTDTDAYDDGLDADETGDSSLSEDGSELDGYSYADR